MATGIRWTLARWMVLVLAGGFAMSVVEHRMEHVEVVHMTRWAWTPIVYSAVMTVACVAGAALWNRGWRWVLRVLFVLGFVVGGAGFYFHNRGQFEQAFTLSAEAWTDPKMMHMDRPPVWPPLVFAGVGLVGAVATLKRFN